MSNTEQVSLDEMIARHEPPAELQNEVEQALWNEAQNGKKRRTRSDKGVMKAPKPAPAPPGAISAHQASELKRRAEVMIAAAHKLAEAERENQRRTEEYYAFIDSMTVTN